MKQPAKVTKWRSAGQNHAVVSREGTGGYRRTPCAQCPWRVDAIGVFPPEAFRLSAPTAYDAALTAFGCHETSENPHPATCAGFLPQGSTHNIGARLAQASGKLDLDTIDDGGHTLHESYREMAIANGVAPDDEALRECRP